MPNQRAKQTWTLTIRDGPRLTRARFEGLPVAIQAMKQRIDELSLELRGQELRFAGRRFEPARRVLVRAEISGPGGLFTAKRGGMDLHGDGSCEPYVGRYKRSSIESEPGESAYDTLGRALSGPGS